MRDTNSNIRLVVIDDDKAVLDSLGALLGHCGYEVSCFASPEAFLAFGGAGEPAAIILDQNMPHMKGLELVSTLRDMQCEVPIVLITARITETERRRAQQLHVDTILEKPFTDDELLDALERIGLPGNA